MRGRSRRDRSNGITCRARIILDRALHLLRTRQGRTSTRLCNSLRVSKTAADRLHSATDSAPRTLLPRTQLHPWYRSCRWLITRNNRCRRRCCSCCCTAVALLTLAEDKVQSASANNFPPAISGVVHDKQTRSRSSMKNL